MTTTTVRVLSEPVTNPKRDRRKNGLSGLAEFPVGRYVVSDTYAYRSGGSRYEGLNRYDSREGFAALAAASTEVAPRGVKEFLATLGEDDAARPVLGWLLREGEVTERQVKEALASLYDNDDWDQV